MLVLSRKNGQKIVITLPNGQEIMLVLNKAKVGNARIGIDAPETIKIFRKELT